MFTLWSSSNHIPIKSRVWLRKQATLDPIYLELGVFYPQKWHMFTMWLMGSWNANKIIESWQQIVGFDQTLYICYGEGLTYSLFDKVGLLKDSDQNLNLT